jgi:hypothetical protein
VIHIKTAVRLLDKTKHFSPGQMQTFLDGFHQLMQGSNLSTLNPQL